MLILGIETSCDETSVAVVRNGTHVLSNVIASSRKTFEKLAGVIPEQAARMQVECMIPVLEEALNTAGVTMEKIDAIAVTKGPGLLGSLLVGTVTARTLASIHKKPLIGVHHTLGHLSSTWLTDPQSPISNLESLFPILTLSASGGHSDIWYRTSHTKGRLLGRTRDDAAGEAFDKGASLLGLPYPGGPSIQKAAHGGDSKAFRFPLPLHEEDTLDFSFSGLKTSLKYLLRDLTDPSPRIADISASFQDGICNHLLDRIKRACERHPDAKELHIVGGVSANLRLRELGLALCQEQNITCRFPSTLAYCTDNAAMIAAAGEFLLQEKSAQEEFETRASLPLESIVC